MPAPHTADMCQMLEDIELAEARDHVEICTVAAVMGQVGELVEFLIMASDEIPIVTRICLVLAWRAACRSN